MTKWNPARESSLKTWAWNLAWTLSTTADFHLNMWESQELICSTNWLMLHPKVNLFVIFQKSQTAFSKLLTDFWVADFAFPQCACQEQKEQSTMLSDTASNDLLSGFLVNRTHQLCRTNFSKTPSYPFWLVSSLLTLATTKLRTYLLTPQAEKTSKSGFSAQLSA